LSPSRGKTVEGKRRSLSEEGRVGKYTDAPHERRVVQLVLKEKGGKEKNFFRKKNMTCN